MKKVISIVSVLSVLGMVACRNGNEEYNGSLSGENDIVLPHYHHRDSTGVSHSCGGKDQEPPRKDLLQWKGGTIKEGSKKILHP